MLAFVAAAQDPELDLANWIQEGTPIGIARRINARGVFPTVDTKVPTQRETDAIWSQSAVGGNYQSFKDAGPLAEAELQRTIDAGHAEFVGTFAEAKKRYGNIAVSKLACSVKDKPDGRRRFGSSLIFAVVSSTPWWWRRSGLCCQDCATCWTMRLRSSGSANTMSRWRPWCRTFRTRSTRYRCTLTRSSIVWRASSMTLCSYSRRSCLGARRVPLRGAGRPRSLTEEAPPCSTPTILHSSVTSMTPLHRPRATGKLDGGDSLWSSCGSSSFGLRMSWKKVARGSRVEWCGATISFPDRYVGKASLSYSFIKALEGDVAACMERPLVKMVILRQISGRATWAFGLVPLLRPVLAPLWAVLAEMAADAERIDSKQKPVHCKVVGREAAVQVTRILPELLWIPGYRRSCDAQSGAAICHGPWTRGYTGPGTPSTLQRTPLPGASGPSSSRTGSLLHTCTTTSRTTTSNASRSRWDHRRPKVHARRSRCSHQDVAPVLVGGAQEGDHEVGFALGARGVRERVIGIGGG